jgi:hypothetical protein
MAASLLLLLKFVYDIAKRLTRDSYFRSLGILVLIMSAIGTLFFWLVEGRTFLQAIAYSVATLAMNSPYGLGMGPATTGGIVFNIFYVVLGTGIFLIFVLEAGKTMVQSYEEFTRKLAEKRALKRSHKEPPDTAASSHSGCPSTNGEPDARLMDPHRRDLH